MLNVYRSYSGWGREGFIKRSLNFHFRKYDRALLFERNPFRITRSLDFGQRKQNSTYGHGVTSPSSSQNQSPKSHSSVDHRELGVQQELFTISKFSAGSPIFLPNGTKIFNKLVQFLRTQYEQFGFQEVISPVIYKASLWKTSGHWENYADSMYTVTGRGASGTQKEKQDGQNEEFGLKPMNCPGHCLIFASKARSYRDLPLRYADFGPLHRNEIAGALSGLTRVRCFHQDDGHIFCRPSQIKEEIGKSLEFIILTYRVLGLGPYRLVLSTRPRENFIGTVEEWDFAESALAESLRNSGLKWTTNEGDGAFYGPKIDIIVRDKDGKEHQTATIQLDFQLPKRFDLHYQAPAPKLEQGGQICTDQSQLSIEGPVTPVLIHRAVLGSVERTMALLIEYYMGIWPFWLNPRQVAIITVNDTPEVLEYARQTKRNIQGLGTLDSDQRKRHSERGIEIGGCSVSVDIHEKAIGVRHKIATAKTQRYGIIVLVGPRDIENNNIIVDFSGIPNRNRYTNNIFQKISLKARLYALGKIVEWNALEPSSPEGSSETIDQYHKDVLKAPTQIEIPPNWLRPIIEELQMTYS
ncbi:putative threonine--tRNA ligase, mitochondrial [Golovinomyces cichoracearum]|uniref:threonine--tRNA ligase n=1 Tax=Golovinomyces cichoracearum TaxID=62708 RepID=A0A420H898_9PEZI|nr:putative threonine--tRNA ligase, mitochondrial [Golovinomyces cichoracearum]